MSIPMQRRRLIALLAAAAGLPAAPVARADAVDALRAFTRDVKTARANFTQTVTSPDGARRRTSSGSFEFSRPNRFRFAYDKPFAQLIVGDGSKVWLHDIDLNQVTVRPMDQALGGTPAALLAGGALDQDFTLAAQPAKDGLDWVLATPKAREGSVASLRVGFRGRPGRAAWPACGWDSAAASWRRWRSSMPSASARCCSSARCSRAWRCRPSASASPRRPAPTSSGPERGRRQSSTLSPRVHSRTRGRSNCWA